jgi:hypothetical protein
MPAYMTTSGFAVFTKAQTFIAEAKAAASDGLTWSEFGELLVKLIRLVASGLEEISGMAGPAKRAMVVETVGMLFDAVADRCVPLVVYPVWVVARPAARALLVAIAGGILEQFLPLMRGVK